MVPIGALRLVPISRYYQIIMNIPNLISFSRIIISLVLLTVMDSTPIFMSLFLIAGISDVADGYIARRFNMVTTAGAILDSFADIVFHLVIFIVLYIKYRWVLEENALLFLVVLGIKLSSAVATRIKFGKILFLHTFANKATGLIVFFAVPIIMITMNNSFIPVLLGIAVIAALEELIIIVKEDKIDLNRKSLFF